MRPEPGYWMLRMRRGRRGTGPEIPASIQSRDHEPGNPENKLDTGPVMYGTVGLREVDPLEVWHASKRPIDRIEFNFQMARLRYIRDHAPHEPEARPHEPVDLNSLPPIGPKE